MSRTPRRPRRDPRPAALLAHQPLTDNRRQLAILHVQIDHHAQPHLEQHRVALPHRGDRRMPQVVPAAQVRQQTRHIKRVAQERGEQRRPRQCVVPLAMEDVDHGRADEPAAGQGDAAAHIHGDPQAPGMLLIQIRRGRQACEEPVEQKRSAGQHHRQQEPHTRRQQFPRHRCSMPVGVFLVRGRIIIHRLIARCALGFLGHRDRRVFDEGFRFLTHLALGPVAPRRQRQCLRSIVRRCQRLSPPRQPHHPGEERVPSNRRDPVLEHAMLDRLCQGWRRLLPDFQESRLLERHARQIHPRGAPDFVFAINVIYITFGMVLHLLVGRLDQVIPFPIDQRLVRARLHACRPLAMARARDAELALAHLRRQDILILVGWYLERAGDHAVPAADALPRIVDHRAVLVFGQRPHDARRHTGRVVAVHAIDLRIHRLGGIGGVLPRIDHRELLGCWPALLLEDRRLIVRFQRSRRHPVGFLARMLARTASGAGGQVHQHTHRIARAGAMATLSCRHRLTRPQRTAAGRGEPSHVLEKVATVRLHSATSPFHPNPSARPRGRNGAACVKDFTIRRQGRATPLQLCTSQMR